jgi:transcription initiation factor TFIIE subunit alpha
VAEIFKVQEIKIDKENMSKQQELVYEIPVSLKQLARLVVRGFYTIEDALIVDMLVRNPCMKVNKLIISKCLKLTGKIAGRRYSRAAQVREEDAASATDAA